MTIPNRISYNEHQPGVSPQEVRNMNVRCPKCPQVLQVSQAGNYRCPKCGAMLTVAVPLEMAPAPRPEQARSQARLIAAGVAAAVLVVIIVVVVVVRSVSSDTPAQAQAEIKQPVAGAVKQSVAGKTPTKELKGSQVRVAWEGSAWELCGSPSSHLQRKWVRVTGVVSNVGGQTVALVGDQYDIWRVYCRFDGAVEGVSGSVTIVGWVEGSQGSSGTVRLAGCRY